MLFKRVRAMCRGVFPSNLVVLQGVVVKFVLLWNYWMVQRKKQRRLYRKLLLQSKLLMHKSLQKFHENCKSCVRNRWNFKLP